MGDQSLLRADHLGLLRARLINAFSSNIKKAIVHGNPDRVEVHASLLKEPMLVAKKRGFVSYVGFIGDEPVLITSCGMGAGSAAIAVEELAELGIKRIIRVGTCGSYREEIRPGDIVVPTEVLVDSPALRYIYSDYLRERPLRQDLPWLQVLEGFYFVKGFENVSTRLLEAAKDVLAEFRADQVHKVFHGPIHDKDILHAWREQYSADRENLLRIKSIVKKLTIATDMESGTLFTLAHLRGIQAGSILVVVDFFGDDKVVHAQDEALELVYKISLKAIKKI